MAFAGIKKCDLCGAEPKEIYDAPTMMGPWAYMCPTCFVLSGRNYAGWKFENKPSGKKLADLPEERRI
jgi:hypothetical protein